MRHRNRDIDHDAGIAPPTREGGMQERTVILICAMVFAVTLVVATTALLVAPKETLGAFLDPEGGFSPLGHKVGAMAALALGVVGIYETRKIGNLFLRMLAIAAEIGFLALALFLYAAHVG